MYIALLLPLTYPEWAPIKGLSRAILMLEVNWRWVIEIGRTVAIVTYMGWTFLADGPIEILVVALAFILFSLLSFYKYRCIRLAWAMFWLLPIISVYMIYYGLMVIYERTNFRHSEVNLDETQREMNNITEDLERNRPKRRRFNRFGFRDLFITSRVQHKPNLYNHYYLSDEEVQAGLQTKWMYRYQGKQKDYVDTTCCICLEEFFVKQEVIELHWTQEHLFHPKWILEWAKDHQTCPVCRTNFYTTYRKQNCKRTAAYTY